MIEYVILATWLSPFFYFSTMLLGYALRYRRESYNHPEIIIQITTIGNDTVNQIIKKIRDYKLSFDVKIWIFTEYWDRRIYSGADLVVHVPEKFTTKYIYVRTKATSLEFSRLLRLEMVKRGELSPNYAVIFLDDDSVPSREFIEDTFNLDYDILQGMICPTNKYGSLMSYVENIRTHACVTTCAFWQGIGRPVWAHGEACAIKYAVERSVSWDMPLVSSEDLSYIHKATSMGFKLKFTYSKINITNPLTFRDMVTQRRRWIWGNIHAIMKILPFWGKVRVSLYWIAGILLYFLPISFGIMVPLGFFKLSTEILPWTFLALGLWLGMWGLCGYINGGNAKHIVLSIVFSFLSITVNTFATIIGLARGPPRKFEVIEKRV